MHTLIQHTRRPDITFFRSGKISISAKAARSLGLAHGDSINIAVSSGSIPCRHSRNGDCTCPPENRRNCRQIEYLLYRIRHDRHSPRRYEARCYPTQKGAATYRANSVRLCRALFSSVGQDVKRISYSVGDPVRHHATLCLPIITLHPLNTNP